MTTSSWTAVVARPGHSFTLPALLLVDGEQVTTDATTLAGVTVTAEIVEHDQGPEDQDPAIQEQDRLQASRQGYRSKLTQVRITDITSA